jgi:long-chain acyl-CoA synthetase
LVRAFGTALIELGVSRGDHVGLMSDNRREWLITDLSLLSIGAVDVPRGSDSTVDEMAYILRHADCKLVFAENRVQMEKILSRRSDLPLLETIVLFDPRDVETPGRSDDVEIRDFHSLLEEGRRLLADRPQQFDEEVAKGKTDDLATLLYTSGTTGEPKGVMLKHRSFLFQMDRIHDILHLTERDIFLSVLPIWHSFERAVEYIVMNYNAGIAYSKPVGSVMLEDMAKIRPTWMTSVPRIWEGIRSAVFRNMKKESAVKRGMFYFFVSVGQAHANLTNVLTGKVPEFTKRSRVVDIATSILPVILLTPFKLIGDALVFSKLRGRLGGRFVAGVSGGGALPPYVDRFFQAAGIKLLEGYGLTETGPILAVRLQDRPVPGTVGPFLPDIDYRVLGDDMSLVPPGRKGVLYVKSPQIMDGYYKKPEETERVLKDGWLNTGDLAMVTHNRECKIVGRTKETIVLLGGENVEPVPIEETLTQSEFIDQAMVVGQDQKYLGALIVPNEEKLTEYAKESGIQYIETDELVEHPEVQDRVREEIQSLVNAKRGFRMFEQVFRFRLLTKHFEVGKELTHTLKIRRDIVNDLYRTEIAELFK